MHFSPLYLILGLLAVVHAAPFPATDGHLTLITRTASSKPPFRIVLNFLDWSYGDSMIPLAVKERIVAHLNHGGSETKTGTSTEKFRTEPLTVDEIKFFPGSIWDPAIDPATGPFRFAWCDTQVQGFKWTDDTAGRKLGVAHVESVKEGEWKVGVAVLSGPGGKSAGISLK
ncbi:hypothetical protein EV368DRAFT_61429 [Lentinula lateritia]|uniref:Uncharacterized protein n=1 Tax=Lentinula aff. lateritia TaxID=2804960 RepID=A0ACC1TTL3_9AGAR|nr:hypothetical protein F5876DRAFT_67751 [Lentinula aff. lateritia]KAJ3856750.1 hypothetical protein EV368DRAFT_61429 [Lentinula lateritia]